MEEQALQQLGLNPNQAKIYLSLLTEGSSTASSISKSIHVHRATVYAELENLTKQGLVSYVIKKFTRYYQAAPPERLIAIIDSKKTLLESILPKLKQVHATQEPTKFAIYEGKEGLKTFLQDIVETAPKEVLSYGVTGNTLDALKYYFPHFVKRYMELKSRARYIANIDSKRKLSKIPKKNISVKYLPKKYSADVTTVIYENTVSIHSIKDGAIYVVMIKDKSLSQSYRNYFECMWELLK